SIEIPANVTSIGYGAFENCSGLMSIKLPFVGAENDGTGNTRFGYIFGASYYYDNDDYVPASLKEVIITGGTSIGSYAFYNCSGLTSIEIPASVTSIGDKAFYGCSSLTSIHFGGTKAEWNAIAKGSIWNSFTGKYTVYCTDGNLSK
ncbi:MAG: leucine-rich repeat domain-containing protein, partial [Clostridia bacterium]|nr:leucine-rich repeat domain-containing protein [Clostridia bacterium]